MFILIIVVGSISVLVVAMVIWSLMIRRRNHLRRLAWTQSLEKLLDLAEQGEAIDEDSLWRLFRNLEWHLGEDQKERYRRVKEALDAERQYLQKLGQGEVLTDQLLEAEGRLEGLEIRAGLVKIFRSLSHANQLRLAEELGLHSDGGWRLLQEKTIGYYQDLLARAGADSQAFFDLCALMEAAKSYKVLGENLAEALRYPDGWNDMVARHIKNPSIVEDFIGWDIRDLKDGKLRLLAAEALRDQNLTAAKVVLAFCNRYKDCLQEVGDYLAGDVAKMVAAHEKAKEEQTS